MLFSGIVNALHFGPQTIVVPHMERRQIFDSTAVDAAGSCQPDFQ